MNVRSNLDTLRCASSRYGTHRSLRLPLWLGIVIVTLLIFRSGADDYAIESGPYQGTKESISDYECPEWFRDAKFGIWVMFGPQSVPEQGDWYARHMYLSEPERFASLFTEEWAVPGHWTNNIGNWEKGAGIRKSQYHRETFGHPSEFGYKDLCNIWKVEELDTDYLMKLYRKCGAKYFVLLVNHHDNYDLWDSTHEWNSVRVGPQKDITRLFEDSARDQGLMFGASLHPSHTTWFSPAWLMSDSSGPHAGVPYDGILTKEDGRGKWWEGLDPQKLYGMPGSELRDWNEEEKRDYFVRVADFIDRYQPDLLYFDHGDLPKGESGVHIAAHYYNASTKWHGTNQAVLNIKSTREYAIKDVERGVVSTKQDRPWQTDMCIGDWYYAKRIQYKSPESMVQMLVDIVSKNGNLLLNIPLKASGEIDQRGIDFLEAIGRWMDVNGEGIYGTRPWAAFGEGASNVQAAGHHNWKGMKFTGSDVRFTAKNGAIYVFAMAWPDGPVEIKALGKESPFVEGRISKVELLGHGDLQFTPRDECLEIEIPVRPKGKFVPCLKIEGLKTHEHAGINDLYTAN